MSSFLTANELNAALENIFEDAELELILISPYIKLHERFKSILKTKLENHKLQLIIVFGKNEKDVSKSMSKEDFEFFKQFPNVQIKHEKRLHAKIYFNEEQVLISSMNLYDYSQDTNIESGVLSSAYDKKLGKNALEYFNRVIDQADLLFDKVPEYEKGLLGISKKYIGSVIEYDASEDFYSNKKITHRKSSRKAKDNSTFQPKIPIGYCIRTGEKIEFNIEKPLNGLSFESWKKYENKDYPEKYCHFSGEESKGQTSFNKPILSKNWKKAKSVHSF